jgi:threonine/homoserine/homoserine lactone efflux protein
VSRQSAWIVLILGAILFLSGLFVTLTASGIFERTESDLLENPFFGSILSGMWDIEFAGRSLAGEWVRSVPLAQAFSILWTLGGVFLIWLGVSALFIPDDWRRR